MRILPIILLFLSWQAQAQDAKPLLREVNKKFRAINDYQAAVNMIFNIPGVKMNSMSGKVFFKRPNKFKIKAKGIFFLPKQNPLQNISSILLDTTAYTAVQSGYETVAGKNCAVVNLIPLKSLDEIILAKFWIDANNPLVLKSQITTKSNGTVETASSYGSQSQYALPDKLLITVEVAKIKVPKMLSVDLNKKSKEKNSVNTKEKGTIELKFSEYKLNQKISDEVFAKD